jgi:hypothetical protein
MTDGNRMLNPVTPYHFPANNARLEMEPISVLANLSLDILGANVLAQEICGTTGWRRLSTTVSTAVAHMKRSQLGYKGQEIAWKS